MSPYRADVVGSMLRPDYLLQARQQHRERSHSDAEFKRIEDRTVDEAITIQERAGIDVVTDGEMRRNVFASQLVHASEGFEAIPDNWVDWFDMDGTQPGHSRFSEQDQAQAQFVGGRFASEAMGNTISFEVQEKKLGLVAQVARLVWSD